MADWLDGQPIHRLCTNDPLVDTVARQKAGIGIFTRQPNGIGNITTESSRTKIKAKAWFIMGSHLY